MSDPAPGRLTSSCKHRNASLHVLRYRDLVPDRQRGKSGYGNSARQIAGPDCEIGKSGITTIAIAVGLDVTRQRRNVVNNTNVVSAAIGVKDQVYVAINSIGNNDVVGSRVAAIDNQDRVLNGRTRNRQIAAETTGYDRIRLGHGESRSDYDEAIAFGLDAITNARGIVCEDVLDSARGIQFFSQISA